MKKSASRPLRALLVSKNMIHGIDPAIANVPIRLEDAKATIYVYHRLVRAPQTTSFEQLSGMHIRRDTQLQPDEFDVVVMYLAAQSAKRILERPPTFPIREIDLRRIKADKVLYVTVDKPELYLPLLNSVGHDTAQVIVTEKNGHMAMGRVLKLLRQNGSLAGISD